MINYPEGLKESELQLYIAAFKRCRELIEEKENHTTVAETVDAIVAQWGPVVNDAEQLRAFFTC